MPALTFRAGRGFTLIELVLVIVVLSILALGTSRYIVNSTQSYVVSAERGKLISSGRVAVEKVTRRLRNALPNSIRVSSTGRCIEFFPVLAGSSTLATIPFSATNLAVAAFDLDSAPTNYATIGAFAASELYVSGTPSPGVIVATGLTTSGANKVSIPLDQVGGHTFTRSSPTERVYIVAQPERFCITTGGNLEKYSGYGINASAPISDNAPAGATTDLIAQNIDLSGGVEPFKYAPGTLARNALVAVTLNLIKNDDPVKISHEVQIRNVP